MEVKTRGGEEEEETAKEDEVLTRLRNGLHQTNRRSLKIFCLSSKLTSTTTQIDDHLTRHSVARARIDRQLMTYLTQNDVINWTQQTCRLAPLKRSRTGGGDGLLRSIVAVVWNLWDSSSNVELLLRRLLHVTLTTGRQNSAFHERWKKEEEQIHRHQSPQVDWENVCSLFKGDNVDNVLSRSDSLDPIHLFSLSNVLRRPIIVIGDILTSTSNENKTKDDLSGVYLPLLSSAEDCVPYPVTLLHSEGVFCPLLVEKRRLDERSGMLPFQAVPLVRFDQEPFHVRCLLGPEQRRVHELMTSYLKVAEIGRNDGSESRVPVARVASNSTTMCRQLINAPRSKVNEPRTENVSGYRESHETKLEEFSCGNREKTKNQLEDAVFCCPEYLDEKKKDKAVNNSSKHPTLNGTLCSDSEKCRSTGCQKEGPKKYGYQCYACYVRNDDDFELISGKPEKQEAIESGQTIPHQLQTASLDTAITNRHHSSAEGNNAIEDTKHDDFNSRTEGLSDDETQSEAAKEFEAKEVEVIDSTSKGADDIEGLTTNSSDDDKPNAKSSEMTKLERGSKLEGDSVEPIRKEWKKSKEEEEEDDEEEAGKCIVNFCENTGRKASNGICKVCYDTLLQHRLRKQNDEKESELKCLTEGCPKAVTNRQLGLCLSCLRQQILAATDLERRASCNSQRTSSSSSDVRGWTTSSPTITTQTHALCSQHHQQQQQQWRRHALKSAGDVFTEEEEEVEEENWLEATKTKSRPPPHPPSQRRSSLQITYSPPPPRRSGQGERGSAARRCLTVDCDRYGDPSYQGLCAECFRQFSHSYGKRSTTSKKKNQY